MNNFPRNRIIFPLITILLIGFSINYFSKLNKSFYQLQYNWDSKKLVELLNIDQIVNYTYSEITLEKSDSNMNFDPRYSYSITTDKEYYFRFNYIENYGNTYHLKDLIWINEQPSHLDNVKTIAKLQIPLKQNPNSLKIAMIGDELIYHNEAKYLRKEVKKSLDVNFLGDRIDLFSTHYLDIEDEKTSIPSDANVVIVFSKTYPKSFYHKLNQFLKLSQKKIIVINAPKHLNDSIDDFDAQQLKIQIDPIYLDPFTGFNKNESTYYYDNKYLTYEAYQKIALSIAKQLK